MAGRRKRMGINQSELARRVGVTQPAISTAIRNGRLSRCVLPDGSIDPIIGVEEWNEVHRPAKPVHEQAAEEGSYAKARADKERYTAELKRLELEERRRTLVKADDVERRWADIAHLVRTRLLAIPDRLAAEVSAEVTRAFREWLLAHDHPAAKEIATTVPATVDLHETRTRLDEEIRSALAELTRTTAELADEDTSLLGDDDEPGVSMADFADGPGDDWDPDEFDDEESDNG